MPTFTIVSGIPGLYNILEEFPDVTKYTHTTTNQSMQGEKYHSHVSFFSSKYPKSVTVTLLKDSSFTCKYCKFISTVDSWF